MKFTYNPRVIEHLGTELITSDEIAIAELIKNSYDAKAKNVNLFFLESLNHLDKEKLVCPLNDEIYDILLDCCGDNSLILLDDNGKGMSYLNLEKGFFEVGSSLKRLEKDERIKKQNDEGVIEDEQIVLGDKGIGRLSAQRLAPILFVETTSVGDKNVHFIKVDWEKFVSSLDAEAEEWQYNTKGQSHYTRIWLCSPKNTSEHKVRVNKYVIEERSRVKDLFGNFFGDEKRILKLNDALSSTISFLYTPFKPSKSVVDFCSYKNGDKINHEFKMDAFKIAETSHSFSFQKNKNGHYCLTSRMLLKPWFLERIHRRLIGNKSLYSDYIKDSIFYGELLKKYESRLESSLSSTFSIEELQKRLKKKVADWQELEKLVPIKGDIYSFKRDRQLLNIACESALKNGFLSAKSRNINLKEILDVHNGIKLYRNDYRIASLGNKDSDWLKLQQKRTVGQQFSRFELGNVIGYVSVNDPLQQYIQETSSREAITDSPPAEALKEVLDYIFNSVFYEFNKLATAIVKDIFEEEQLLPEISSKTLKTNSMMLEEQLSGLKNEMATFGKLISSIQNNIELDSTKKVEGMKIALKAATNNFDTIVEYLDKSSVQAGVVTKDIDMVEAEKKRIEIEVYNNFKLMANGLITEAITHELHSVVSTHKCDEEYAVKFANVKNFLIESKAFKVNKLNLQPLKIQYDLMIRKISEVGNFYNFLEKTFVRQGTLDEFEPINLEEFIIDFKKQFLDELKNHKITVVCEELDSVNVMVPKGTLVHLFYNLFYNSIYWIQERQRKARQEDFFLRTCNDEIRISKGDNNHSIRVSDTGTGVLTQYRENLFLPFVTGKGREGRGMGLYVVKRLLESFDASISLLSNENEFSNRYIFQIDFNTGSMMNQEQDNE
jgi:hypothetical protein